MELSQYVINTGRKVSDGLGGEYDEKIISKENIARLLDASNGKAGIFAVVTSIYKDERDIRGGFFARAYNSEHLFSKNYAPAEEEFKRLYALLDKEHWLFEKTSLDKRRIKTGVFSNIGCGKFRLSLGGSLNFLSEGFEKGISAISFGDKINVSLNRVYISLDSITYSDKHKALCYTYEYYVTAYVPIILD